MAVETLPAVPADNDGLVATHKKNRFQVSNTNKPLFIYVNLAKKYIQQHNEVELSALGMGIGSLRRHIPRPSNYVRGYNCRDPQEQWRGYREEGLEIIHWNEGREPWRMIQKAKSEAKPKAKEQQEKVDAEDRKKEKEEESALLD